MFVLTEAHLRLLRQATVMWVPVESGAPGILISPLQLEESLKESPNAQLEPDIARRAGLTIGTGPGATDVAHVRTPDVGRALSPPC